MFKSTNHFPILNGFTWKIKSSFSKWAIQTHSGLHDIWDAFSEEGLGWCMLHLQHKISCFFTPWYEVVPFPLQILHLQYIIGSFHSDEATTWHDTHCLYRIHQQQQEDINWIVKQTGNCTFYRCFLSVKITLCQGSVHYLGLISAPDASNPPTACRPQPGAWLTQHSLGPKHNNQGGSSQKTCKTIIQVDWLTQLAMCLILPNITVSLPFVRWCCLVVLCLHILISKLSWTLFSLYLT